jgi:hypothetical protein
MLSGIFQTPSAGRSRVSALGAPPASAKRAETARHVDGISNPGSILVREWDGHLHRVMALEQGFAWEGRTYPSLSQVVRAITGGHWNGPRFFGLTGSKAMARAAETIAPAEGARTSGVDKDGRATP